MNHLQDQVLVSSSGRSFAYDLYFPEADQPLPLVLFAHGFKGFKDWGHWHLIGSRIAQEGFAFLKFNFSHNGVTPEQPTEFVALDAFAENNYTKELQDLDTLLEAVFSGSPPFEKNRIDPTRLALIGHSRGGGIAIVKAALDPRIRVLITWAAVDRLDNLWKSKLVLDKWKANGVLHLHNARTGQLMAVHLQHLEDYLRHGLTYQLSYQAPRVQIPWLILHGTADPAIPMEAALQLRDWQPRAVLDLIEGADHVFGGQHPPESSDLSKHAELLTNATIQFLKRHLTGAAGA